MAVQDLVNNIIQEWRELHAEKQTYMSVWEEISEFCYPGQRFLSRYLTGATNKRRGISDPTAEQSLDIFASSMIGLIANPATKWLNYKIIDGDSDVPDREIGLFTDAAQRLALDTLSNPRVKFYDNFYTLLKMVGAYGCAALVMDSDDEDTLKFRVESPRNIYFTEDYQGNVDSIYIERFYTVQQLMQQGEKAGWTLPQGLEQRGKKEKIHVLRKLYKNPGYNPNKLGYAFAKYHSVHVMPEGGHELHKGFLNYMPVAIARWDRVDHEKWPDSPARVALASVKVTNAAERGLMVGIEKEYNPTLVVSSEAKYGKLDTSPGSVMVGRGNPNDTIRELRTTGNLSNAFQWLEFKRQQIRSAFYVDVFQTAVDINITATEAAIRNQERLRNVAPKAAKIQADVLGAVCEVIMQRKLEMGQLELPAALTRSNKDVRAVFISPILSAQRLEEANSILQYMNDITLMAQVNPDVLDKIDFDRTSDLMAEVRNIPLSIMRGAEEVEKIRKARQQQQQLSVLSGAIQNQAAGAAVSGREGGSQGLPVTLQ